MMMSGLQYLGINLYYYYHNLTYGSAVVCENIALN